MIDPVSCPVVWLGVGRGLSRHPSFEKRVLAGDEVVRLCERYTAKVVLVVNTASKFAFTPQYDGLEELYRKYRYRGLVVLGFPGNDFGAQDPGSEQQVREFSRRLKPHKTISEVWGCPRQSLYPQTP